ncbi:MULTISPECIES: bacteriorhodopsin [Halorussus]|uniref:bacteriorhodopsin n=1 Tax=Halorussus TaxID=1070314 RepID=UPI000E21142E|nr:MULTISPECIES: bacteriorhodopsin [Halorussus]NHN61538.1 bacteriorhodopsin [Halorussus sp. JP-T4]
MISASVLHGAAAGAYGVTLVVLLAWLRRVPERARRYCHVMIGVVGVGLATGLLAAGGVGAVTVNGRELLLPTFANDVVAYSLLWAVTAMLADVPRRTLAFVTGLPALQVVAFQFGASAGGLLGLVSIAIVIGGHFVLAYLFLGSIWRSAQELPDERRLLHWKSRNLLLFLIGMLIAFAFISLAGWFTEFGTTVIQQYISVLIRVGFAGFLFANVDALDADGRDDAPTTDSAPADYASPAPDAADD